MIDFWSGEYDVMVATTIIESGLDLPKVNTLIVERADLLGLAQLYQLRGRVGGRISAAYAYLPPRQPGPYRGRPPAAGGDRGADRSPVRTISPERSRDQGGRGRSSERSRVATSLGGLRSVRGAGGRGGLRA